MSSISPGLTGPNGFFEPDSYVLKTARQPWSYTATQDVSRFEVRSGDVYDSFDRALDKERAETSSLKKFQLDRGYTIEYQFMVEPGARNTADWLVVGQMAQPVDKDGAEASGPPLAIQLQGEKMAVVAYTSNDPILTVDPPRQQLFKDTADIERGHWYDIKLEFRFDPDGAGYIDIWRDGVKIVEYEGPTGYNGKLGYWWVQGIYRHETSETIAVQYKDVTVTGEGAPLPIVGSEGDDPRILGGWENEKLYGLGGSDRLDGGKYADEMYGGSGSDAYVVDDENDKVVELVGEGTGDVIYTTLNWILASDTEVEFLKPLSISSVKTLRLTGNGFDNNIYGNAGVNYLTGRAGADRLFGDAGDDTLRGEEGEDYLEGGAGADLLSGGVDGDFLRGSAGLDTLRGDEGDDKLYGGDDADRIFGNDGADLLFGERGEDKLYGGAGADRLDGGEGADRLRGETGDDSYFVEQGDIVEEFVGEGIDTVYASTRYLLNAAAEVEFLRTSNVASRATIALTGNDFDNSIYGNAGINVLSGRGGVDLIFGDAGNDELYGDGGNDKLYGGSGNDKLDGGADNDQLYGDDGGDKLYGGLGNDRLEGGTGNDEHYGGDGDDTYFVDWVGDAVFEYDLEGTDTIYATGSFNLGADSHVEFIRAQESPTGARIDLSGSDIANSIYGNSTANTLRGGGGGDMVNAGDGDDTLYGDSGVDRLYGDLGADTLHGGSEDDLLYGNEDNDTLYGDAGNDRMDGGSGNDDMSGGDGNDTYFVDSALDQIFENLNEGVDTVNALVSHSLRADAEVEILRTDRAGVGEIDLSGSDTINTIYGNAGNNVLNGRGGVDSLWGYDGADTFVFSSAAEAGDRIADFGPGEDLIGLVAAGFGVGIGVGTLEQAGVSFELGRIATTANETIFYDQGTGRAFWDQDGTGAAVAQAIAFLANKPVVDASDFAFI